VFRNEPPVASVGRPVGSTSHRFARAGAAASIPAAGYLVISKVVFPDLNFGEVILFHVKPLKILDKPLFYQTLPFCFYIC